MEVYIKMGKKIIKFGNTEIEKQKFHQHKGLILISNIDINKLILSNKVSCGKKTFKYFIGYKDAKKVHFYGYFSAHIRNFDETNAGLLW